jgi:four helix bundle protein
MAKVDGLRGAGVRPVRRDSGAHRCRRGLTASSIGCVDSVQHPEGYDRPGPEQLVYLRHARGSLWEAATQLEILARRGQLKAETLLALLQDADEIGRILHGYMAPRRRSLTCQPLSPSLTLPLAPAA